VPTPADGTTLYLKLRDDPDAVASITLPTPIQKHASTPVPSAQTASPAPNTATASEHAAEAPKAPAAGPAAPSQTATPQP